MPRWSPKAIRSRCSKRPAAPAARSASPGLAPMFQEVAANPESFERYIKDMVAACTRQWRDVPPVHRCREQSRIAGAVRPHRCGDRRELSATGSVRWRWRCSISAPADGPGCPRSCRSPGSRLVLLSGAERHRRPVQGLANSRSDRHRHRRCGEARQEQGGDRQRLRGGVARQLISVARTRTRAPGLWQSPTQPLRWRHADAAGCIGGAGRARRPARSPRARLSEPPHHHRGALPGRRPGRCDGAADRAIGRQRVSASRSRWTIAAAARA